MSKIIQVSFLQRVGKHVIFFSEEVDASVPIGIFKRNSVDLLNNNFMMSAFLPFAKKKKKISTRETNFCNRRSGFS